MHIIFLIFLHEYFSFLFAVDLTSLRPDVNNSFLVMPANPYSLYCCGGWEEANFVLCPENTFLKSYRLIYDSYYGLINIGFNCKYQDLSKTDVFSMDFPAYDESGLYGSSTSDLLSESCLDIDFVVGISLKVYCSNSLAPADKRGIIGVNMRCSLSQQILLNIAGLSLPADSPWTDEMYCKAGAVICGYIMRYNRNYTDCLASGVDIQPQCCRICDEDNGFFFDSVTRDCQLCSIECRKCYGKADNCTLCASIATLENNKCVFMNGTNATVDEELFETNSPPMFSGWTSSGVNSQVCSKFSMIRAVKDGNRRIWLNKTFSNLPPHYYLYLTFQFYKIGFWNDGDIACVLINGINLACGSLWPTFAEPLKYTETCPDSEKVYSSFRGVAAFAYAQDSLNLSFDSLVSVDTVGYFGINRLKLVVYLCANNCKTCENSATNCKSCDVGYGLIDSNCERICVNYFLESDDSCYNDCPSPYFADPTTGLCVMNCPNGYYQYVDGDQRICHNVCPSGTYGNPITGVCVQSCPSGSYGDQPIAMCLPCDFKCLLCGVTYSNDCNQCFVENTITIPSLGGICELKSYMQPLEINIFSDIPNENLGASGWELNGFPITQQNTSFCSNYHLIGGYQLLGGTSYLRKLYTNLPPHRLVFIAFLVMKIDNWNPNKLVVKIDGYSSLEFVFYSYQDSNAYTLCGSPSYPEALRQGRLAQRHNSSSMELVFSTDLTTTALEASWGIMNLNVYIGLCDSSCDTCSECGNSSACISCPDGSYLHSNSCISLCPSETFGDSSTNTCIDCDSSCLTCNGSSPHDCLSCGYPMYLRNEPPATCESTCPSDTYQDNTNRKCQKCHTSCATCANSGETFCLSCPTGSSLLISPGPSSCISPCLEGTYLDPITSLCQSCDPSCSSCLNEDSNGCIYCADGLFLQDSTAPQSCLEDCPLRKFKHETNRTCLDCHSSCLSCSGSQPEDCLSCVQGSLNNPPGPSSCILGCDDGFYIDNGVCKPCDSSCSKCTKENVNGCISCQSGMFLQNSTLPTTCLSTCPSSKFKYLPNNTCLSCHINCSTCFGPLNSQCLSCNIGTFLKIISENYGYCTEICPDNTYYNMQSNICSQCNSICGSCFGPSENECLSCSLNTSLLSNGRCVEECPLDKYVDLKDKNCKSCCDNCEICESLMSCEKCLNGFFLTAESKCEKIKDITFFVKNITNPFTFELEFSENWPFLLNNIDSFIDLYLISNENVKITSKDFIHSSSNNKSVVLTMKYNGDFKENTTILQVNISIDYTKSDNLFFLANTSQRVPLKGYLTCNENEYYDPNSEMIIKKSDMSPVLDYTINELNISLKLSFFSPRVALNINEFSKASITNFLNNKDFSYKIDPSNYSDSEFFIIISPNKSIIGGPLLTYTLLIPQDVIFIENFLVSSNVSSIKLHDYYLISDEEKTAIESSKTQTTATSYIATGTTYANSVAASGTPMLLQGIMLAELIYLLKYIDINYPPNTLGIFKAESQIFTMFFFYKFDDKQKDTQKLPWRFRHYGISPYFLENAGEIICKNGAILILVYGLTIIVHKTQNKNFFLFKLLRKIQEMLVWELVLFFMLLYMQKFVFYLFSNIMFYSLETESGKINLSIAAAFIFGQILFLVHLFYILHLIKFMKNTNKNNKSVKKVPSSSSLEEKEVSSNRAVSFFDEQNLIKSGGDSIIEPTAFASPQSSNTTKKNNINFTKSKENSEKPRKSYIKDCKKASLMEKIKKIFLKNSIISYLYFPKDQKKFLKQYEFLHQDLHNESIWQIYYVWIDYLRQTSLSILAAVLYFSPFLQIFLINLINLAFIVYFILAFPYRSKILFFVALVSELITESALVGALGLAILDLNQETNEKTRLFLGWIIIGANLALLYWLCFAGVVKLMLLCYEKRKNAKIVSEGTKT